MDCREKREFELSLNKCTIDKLNHQSSDLYEENKRTTEDNHGLSVML